MQTQTVKEIETTQPTPEQLLALLDTQLAQKRQLRTGRGKNRTAILVAGMMLIVLGTAVALLVLQQLLAGRDGSLAARSTQSLDVR